MLETIKLIATLCALNSYSNSGDVVVTQYEYQNKCQTQLAACVDAKYSYPGSEKWSESDLLKCLAVRKVGK